MFLLQACVVPLEGCRVQHICVSGWSAGADPSAGSQFQQIAPVSSLLRGHTKKMYYSQVLIRLNISHSSCLGCPNLLKLSLLPGVMQLTGSEVTSEQRWYEGTAPQKDGRQQQLEQWLEGEEWELLRCCHKDWKHRCQESLLLHCRHRAENIQRTDIS